MGPEIWGTQREPPPSLGDVGRLTVRGGVYRETRRTRKLAR